MSDQEFERDDLEYNDGLGDLLREKEHIQFSWTKTLGVIVVLALLITAGLWAFFKTSGNRTPHETVTPTYVAEHVELAQEYDDKQNERDANTDSKIETLNIKAPKIDESEKEDEQVDMVIKQLMNKSKVNPAKTNIPSVTPVPSATDTIYRVIAGSFTSKSNAEGMVAKLSRHRIPAFVRTVGPNKFHVQAGAFSSHDKAKRHMKTLKNKGVDAYILTKQ